MKIPFHKFNDNKHWSFNEAGEWPGFPSVVYHPTGVIIGWWPLFHTRYFWEFK